MSAYMIAQFKSSSAYDAYRKAVGPFNQKFGAKMLSKPGTAVLLEGNWDKDSLVVIEFASMAEAKRFYGSDKYKEIKALRKDAPPITIVLVDAQ